MKSSTRNIDSMVISPKKPTPSILTPTMNSNGLHQQPSVATTSAASDANSSSAPSYYSQLIARKNLTSPTTNPPPHFQSQFLSSSSNLRTQNHASSSQSPPPIHKTSTQQSNQQNNAIFKQTTTTATATKSITANNTTNNFNQSQQLQQQHYQQQSQQSSTSTQQQHKISDTLPSPSSHQNLQFLRTNLLSFNPPRQLSTDAQLSSTISASKQQQNQQQNQQEHPSKSSQQQSQLYSSVRHELNHAAAQSSSPQPQSYHNNQNAALIAQYSRTATKQQPQNQHHHHHNQSPINNSNPAAAAAAATNALLSSQQQIHQHLMQLGARIKEQSLRNNHENQNNNQNQHHHLVPPLSVPSPRTQTTTTSSIIQNNNNNNNNASLSTHPADLLGSSLVNRFYQSVKSNATASQLQQLQQQQQQQQQNQQEHQILTTSAVHARNSSEMNFSKPNTLTNAIHSQKHPSAQNDSQMSQNNNNSDTGSATTSNNINHSQNNNNNNVTSSNSAQIWRKENQQRNRNLSRGQQSESVDLKSLEKHSAELVQQVQKVIKTNQQYAAAAAAKHTMPLSSTMQSTNYSKPDQIVTKRSKQSQLNVPSSSSSTVSAAAAAAPSVVAASTSHSPSLVGRVITQQQKATTQQSSNERHAPQISTAHSPITGVTVATSENQKNTTATSYLQSTTTANRQKKIEAGTNLLPLESRELIYSQKFENNINYSAPPIASSTSCFVYNHSNNNTNHRLTTANAVGTTPSQAGVDKMSILPAQRECRSVEKVIKNLTHWTTSHVLEKHKAVQQMQQQQQQQQQQQYTHQLLQRDQQQQHLYSANDMLPSRTSCTTSCDALLTNPISLSLPQRVNLKSTNYTPLSKLTSSSTSNIINNNNNEEKPNNISPQIMKDNIIIISNNNNNHPTIDTLANHAYSINARTTVSRNSFSEGPSAENNNNKFHSSFHEANNQLKHTPTNQNNQHHHYPQSAVVLAESPVLSPTHSFADLMNQSLTYSSKRKTPSATTTSTTEPSTITHTPLSLKPTTNAIHRPFSTVASYNQKQQHSTINNNITTSNNFAITSTTATTTTNNANNQMPSDISDQKSRQDLFTHSIYFLHENNPQTSSITQQNKINRMNQSVNNNNNNNNHNLSCNHSNTSNGNISPHLHNHDNFLLSTTSKRISVNNLIPSNLLNLSNNSSTSNSKLRMIPASTPTATASATATTSEKPSPSPIPITTNKQEQQSHPFKNGFPSQLHCESPCTMSATTAEPKNLSAYTISMPQNSIGSSLNSNNYPQNQSLKNNNHQSSTSTVSPTPSYFTLLQPEVESSPPVQYTPTNPSPFLTAVSLHQTHNSSLSHNNSQNTRQPLPIQRDDPIMHHHLTDTLLQQPIHHDNPYQRISHFSPSIDQISQNIAAAATASFDFPLETFLTGAAAAAASRATPMQTDSDFNPNQPHFQYPASQFQQSTTTQTYLNRSLSELYSRMIKSIKSFEHTKQANYSQQSRIVELEQQNRDLLSEKQTREYATTQSILIKDAEIANLRQQIQQLQAQQEQQQWQQNNNNNNNNTYYNSSNPYESKSNYNNHRNNHTDHLMEYQQQQRSDQTQHFANYPSDFDTPSQQKLSIEELKLKYMVPQFSLKRKSMNKKKHLQQQQQKQQQQQFHQPTQKQFDLEESPTWKKSEFEKKEQNLNDSLELLQSISKQKKKNSASPNSNSNSNSTQIRKSYDSTNQQFPMFKVLDDHQTTASSAAVAVQATTSSEQQFSQSNNSISKSNPIQKQYILSQLPSLLATLPRDELIQIGSSRLSTYSHSEYKNIAQADTFLVNNSFGALDDLPSSSRFQSEAQQLQQQQQPPNVFSLSNFGGDAQPDTARSRTQNKAAPESQSSTHQQERLLTPLAAEPHSTFQMSFEAFPATQYNNYNNNNDDNSSDNDDGDHDSEGGNTTNNNNRECGQNPLSNRLLLPTSSREQLQSNNILLQQQQQQQQQACISFVNQSFG